MTPAKVSQPGWGWRGLCRQPAGGGKPGWGEQRAGFLPHSSACGLCCVTVGRCRCFSGISVTPAPRTYLAGFLRIRWVSPPRHVWFGHAASSLFLEGAASNFILKAFPPCLPLPLQTAGSGEGTWCSWGSQVLGHCGPLSLPPDLLRLHSWN